jgi:hypothetical protein
VQAVDNNGEASAGSISITCSNPNPSISLSKGASVNTTDCNVSYCAKLHVVLQNFQPGSTVALHCIGNGTEFYSQNVAWNFSGDLSCYYGFHRPVTVTSTSPVNRASNSVDW